MEECHKMLTDHINWVNPKGDQVRIDRVEDLQLGIESYQTQLNLTKPGWDAKGFEFKHDYTITESPQAVRFPVNNNERKIMRFNEMYKFSDGTLTRILEALDYRVKEYKVNQLNPGRGFLPTANAVIDYRKAKIAIGERITRKDFLDCHLPKEWEIDRDAKINPFKDVLVLRRMVEFLGALLINLKRNMWESKDLIDNLINWDKTPKDKDGAWHAKIRITDPDGEEFIKTLQSIPITRKLSERESPRKIINLDHFYDT
nr:hypothetical protein [Tanacetum cinerariifolium]